MSADKIDDGWPRSARAPLYWCFISYRHADNQDEGRQWATWLHHSIETYEVPLDLVGTRNLRGEQIPGRIFPVFRDEDELPADADLAAPIYRALEGSTVLLVLCSPQAVASIYVGNEIRYFKQIGKADRVLAAILEGEPNASWDTVKNQGEPARGTELECFPPALQHPVDANGRLDPTQRCEPVAADFRLPGTTARGWTSPEAYRRALRSAGGLEPREIDRLVERYRRQSELARLKIVAGILGVPLGQLTQRDKAYQLEAARRRARTLRRWLAATAALALVAVVGGLLAWKAERTAALERDAKELARKAEASERARAQEQSHRRQQLLEEAARSDRVAAEQRLAAHQGHLALAHLARSIAYQPDSTLSAEKAFVALNDWHHPVPLVVTPPADGLYQVRFSPDGRKVATGASNGAVGLFDAQTGARLASFPGGELPVMSVRFSPDGKRLLCASRDGDARIWDLVDRKQIAKLVGHSKELNGAEFSPDGRRAVTVSEDRTARVWDAQSGALLGTLTGHREQVNTAAFSADGHRIVTASSDNTVRLWNGDDASLITTLEGHTSTVHSAEFSPDGQSIVTASVDRTARVWDAQSGHLRTTISGHNGDVPTAHFSPDSRRVVTASDDGQTGVWDATSGQLVVAFLAGVPIADAQFSPDGSAVAAIVTTEVRIWNLKSERWVSTLQGHTGEVLCLQYSADGRTIATGSRDGTARIWPAQLEAKPLESDEHRFNDVELSADGRRVATTSWGEKAVRVWDAATGSLRRELSGQNRAYRVAISPDGDRVAAAMEAGGPRLWGTERGQLLSELGADETPVVRFGGAGTRLVTGAGNSALIWESKTGKRVAELKEHTARVENAWLSSDGEQVVSTVFEGKAASLWEVKTGRLMATLSHQGKIPEVQFSRDGQSILTASWDHTAAVWDSRTGHKLLNLTGHQYDMLGAHFTADGQRIVTISGDVIRVWDAKKRDGIATWSVWCGAPLVFRSAEFSPEGTHIVAVVSDGTARLYEISRQTPVATLRAGGNIVRARYVPHHACIVAGISHMTRNSYTDVGESLRMYSVLPEDAGPIPEWFPEFLHYMAQNRFKPDGELEIIPSDEWLTLRERLRKILRENPRHQKSYVDLLREHISE